MREGEKELRFCSAQEMRAEELEGKPVLRGYAAVFNQLSVNFGGWREVILPGAFKATLAGLPDVRAVVDHKGGLSTIGRTKNSTLRLAEDDVGLSVEIDPPDTQAGLDIVKLVERGDINQMSFAFWVIRQNWIHGDDYATRELVEVDIDDGDVAVVTYPAYKQTEIQARSLMNLPELPPEFNLSGQGSGSDKNEGVVQVCNARRRRMLDLLGAM